MPRLRGTPAKLPAPEHCWPLLNKRLFGESTIGGQDHAILPDALPIDLGEIYGRTAPIALEIGFNRGRFLTDLARRHPEWNVLGIEIRRKFCWRLTHVLGTSDDAPRNLRIIWSDAKLVTEPVLGHGACTAIFVNFPDPWWKRRHAKRRLVSPDYAKELFSLLAPGGQIWVKSDVKAIADEIRDSLATVPQLTAPTPFGEDDLPLTHRERSCIAQGMEIHRYRVQRLPE